MSPAVLLGILGVLAVLQQPPAPSVSPSSFVGTWVGLQTWAVDHPSPGAKEEQEVTLVIEEVGGKLVGKMAPFLGGSDGAAFGDVQIVGDELRAAAVLGKRVDVGEAAPSSNMARDWKDAVRIRFVFTPDRNSLRGTSDVQLNGINWLKFKYELSRKRSRY